jgi:hypothetical protein
VSDSNAQEDAPISPMQSAPEPEYHISLHGEGLTLERQIDRVAALEIIKIAMGGSDLDEPIPQERRGGSSGGGSDRQGRGPSVKEYLLQKGAKTNPEKILVIAHYLEYEVKVEHFDREQVKAQFKPAGETLPGNYPRDFQQVITNGWIASDHKDPNAFFVTNTGAEVVQAGFSAGPRPTGRPRRRRKASASKPNAQSE